MMSFFDNLRHIPANTKPPGTLATTAPENNHDPMVPLLNLSTIQSRMDSLQKFLSDSVNSDTLLGQHQMDMVSGEITAAIHQIIVNGAALIASTQSENLNNSPEVKNLKSNHKRTFSQIDRKMEVSEEDAGEDLEIIELDAVELLAEHIHFCEICGKGFKRDANLRMHMRAHGNRFKTLEALAKPDNKSIESGGPNPNNKKIRFSCPFAGCTRNKSHIKFRPLKSAICVKNHFKRSHCPKMYSCNRCNKKSFSVMADLKSHMKHCGETKWKCSCGTSFSRKDKLFGHMALFDGHMPAVDAAATAAEAVAEAEDAEMDISGGSDNGFLDRLMHDDYESIDTYCFQDILGSSSPNVSGSTDLDTVSRNIDWFL